jgi:hypothetical protein
MVVATSPDPVPTATLRISLTHRHTDTYKIPAAINVSPTFPSVMQQFTDMVYSHSPGKTSEREREYIILYPSSMFGPPCDISAEKRKEEVAAPEPQNLFFNQ